LAAVLAVPLLLYALVATGQKAVENYRLNQQADGLRSEIAELRAQNIQLQQDIERARTDSAIERIAREQLGLIRPGDHPLIVVPDGAESAAPAAVPRSSVVPAAVPSSGAAPAVGTPSSAPTKPTWRQWLDYFFG
jgi:cell division protein FtsL